MTHESKQTHTDQNKQDLGSHKHPNKLAKTSVSVLVQRTPENDQQIAIAKATDFPPQKEPDNLD